MPDHLGGESFVNWTQNADVRDHLAAERTFLAWIRTGIALMGFGFVVARFGFFLQRRMVQGLASPRSHTISQWIGTALIAAGIFVDLWSARNHARLARESNQGAAPRSGPSTQTVVIALFLASAGLAMATYLIVVAGSTPASFGKDQESDMTLVPNNGIISKSSKHTVDETVDRLRTILQSKGVTLFAIIDHSGEAKKVGMKMPATKLLIFGSPKTGTPLMQASPSIAIDLPLKILVAEDSNGKVSVSYNSPEYLQQRHGLPPQLLPNIAVVEALAAKAAE